MTTPTREQRRYMFGTTDIEEMAKRLMEMQEDSLDAQSTLSEELEKHDLAGQLTELTDMLNQIIPLAEAFANVLSEEEVAEMNQALHDTQSTLGKMSEEIDKLKNIEGE